MVWLFTLVIGFALTSFSTYVNPDHAPVDHIWPLVFGLTIVTLSATIIHAEKEVDRTRVGHHYGIWLLRGLFIAAVTLLVYRSISSITLGLFIAQAAVFAFSFNLLYNHFKGNHWSYGGSQAFWDQPYRKYPKTYLLFWFVVYVVTCAVLWN